jgi:hypothetical protein
MWWNRKRARPDADVDVEPDETDDFGAEAAAAVSPHRNAYILMGIGG